MARGKPKWGDEVEEVIKNSKGEFFVANRAEKVPKDLVEERNGFYWKKRNPDNCSK